MNIKAFVAIIFSLLLGYILTILPLPIWAIDYRPPWILMIIIFWILALPQEINIGTAWFLGLFLDTLTGTTLGLHAACLTLSAYFLVRLQRYYSFYSFYQRLIVIFLTLLIYQGGALILYGIIYRIYLNWQTWLTPIFAVILWPILVKILNQYSQKYISTAQVVK